MMKLPSLFSIFAFLGAGAVSLEAAQKWDEMDYGRFLSATFNNAEGKTTFDRKGCATNKGIAIKLGQGTAATALFDTELCRMAGAWLDGWLKLKGVAFDGAHGPNPQPADNAALVFQTDPGPGWSRGSDFGDPRPIPTGPGAAKIPLGPLPRDWAKYKGLYWSGENVVLAYSVGAAEVLESPALENAGGRAFITRTFHVVARGAVPTQLLVANGERAELSADKRIVTLAPDSKTPDARVFIAVIGAPAGAAWEVRDDRVALKLPTFAGNEMFKVIYSRGVPADAGTFASAVSNVAKPASLAPFLKGGASHWSQLVTTKGVPGKSDASAAFVVDAITPPVDNPYKAWIRFAGVDFFKDGRAALCTWSGDVWIASGLDESLSAIQWRRHASGLFQALGLKIVDEKIYVLGRDQITRLHDLNDDGEADFYENFNNDVQVTPGFHEFALDLQTDPAGNFYFCKGGPVNPGGRGWGPLSDHNGAMLRVSKDGQKLEVFATGVRAPNGMGVGPQGQITCGDNQGTWVPACYVHLVKQGDFISVADLAHRAEKPTDYGRHICFFPMDVDNSGGAQVWVTSDKWGPMKDRLLHLSYGQASLLAILPETVNGQVQGGAVKLPVNFETGTMRGRFHPVDGQLYICGLRGWQTKGSKDAAFYRVRYTGKPVHLQSSLHVTDKGIQIGFFNPVDPTTAGDAGNYSIQQYNYRWTQDYGSAEYKVSNPQEKGRDDVEIKAVKVAPDHKSVFLEVAGLQPVMQMRIKMNLKSADGVPLPKEITNTINAVGKQ